MLDSPFKLSQNKNRGLESHSYPRSVLDLINLTDEYESGMSGTSGKNQFVVYLLSKLMGCLALRGWPTSVAMQSLRSSLRSIVCV